eukprot:1140098-Pelagomonas_calceolata.AAC.4
MAPCCQALNHLRRKWNTSYLIELISLHEEKGNKGFKKAESLQLKQLTAGLFMMKGRVHARLEREGFAVPCDIIAPARKGNFTTAKKRHLQLKQDNCSMKPLPEGTRHAAFGVDPEAVEAVAAVVLGLILYERRVKIKGTSKRFLLETASLAARPAGLCPLTSPLPTEVS